MFKQIMIEHYMSDFFGYGSWDSEYWFIGLEEGTGKAIVSGKETEDSVEIFKEKLAIFSKIGCSKIAPYHFTNNKDSLLDNETFQKKLYPNYFDHEISNPQATHKQLIRILYYIKYDKFIQSDAEIKLIQAVDFGSHHPCCLPYHASIELLPFPSPSKEGVKVIKYYKQYNEHFWKQGKSKKHREAYENICFSNGFGGRIQSLKDKIDAYKEKLKLILFYAPEHFDTILKITDSQYGDWSCRIVYCPTIIEPSYMLCLVKNHILFIVTRHPARFKTKEYWEGVAKEVKKLLP